MKAESELCFPIRGKEGVSYLRISVFVKLFTIAHRNQTAILTSEVWPTVNTTRAHAVVRNPEFGMIFIRATKS